MAKSKEENLWPFKYDGSEESPRRLDTVRRAGRYALKATLVGALTVGAGLLGLFVVKPELLGDEPDKPRPELCGKPYVDMLLRESMSTDISKTVSVMPDSVLAVKIIVNSFGNIEHDYIEAPIIIPTACGNYVAGKNSVTGSLEKWSEHETVLCVPANTSLAVRDVYLGPSVPGSNAYKADVGRFRYTFEGVSESLCSQKLTLDEAVQMTFNSRVS